MEYIPLNTRQQAEHIDRIHQARSGEIYSSNQHPLEEQLRIFNALRMAEIALVSPNNRMDDYVIGTATKPDEIRTNVYGTSLLISSEHATRSMNTNPETGEKITKMSEPGTAALASVIAKATSGTHIAMVGMQTGNANFDPAHPYKQHIASLVQANAYEAYFSIHGMQTGLVSDLDDDRCFDMLIGIGESPSAKTILRANNVKRQAESLGLRVAINMPFLDIDKRKGQYWLKVDDDGTPITNIFAAPYHTTHATAENSAHLAHLDMAAIQIELSGALRIMPGDVNTDTKNSVVPTGPFLAYVALKNSPSLP